ncbi:DUF3896 family protein [Calidifontibacillus erzurumensis]|uniref:DUF3896 family protein n=1 Tax=Calidifontibacillus erzurumensis TaxID=2741433 RepID=UPI0035B50604
MNYQELIATMEERKAILLKQLEDNKLSKEDYDTIQNSIDNYDYIIELIEMNYFERGQTIH